MNRVHDVEGLKVAYLQGMQAFPLGSGTVG